MENQAGENRRKGSQRKPNRLPVCYDVHRRLHNPMFSYLLTHRLVSTSLSLLYGNNPRADVTLLTVKLYLGLIEFRFSLFLCKGTFTNVK